MKIGIVCYPTYGGSGVLATELGKALAHKGHIVHFITYSQPIRLDEFNENIFFHEVRFVDYPLFEYAPLESVMISKLVDVIRHEKLDLLHVHYAIPHAAVAYQAKQILKSFDIQIPIVTTLHGTDITLVGKDPTYSTIVTFSLNKSDGVTAVSKFLKYETQKYFHIRRPIEVIYNFVDLKRFMPLCNPQIKSRFAPNNEFILLHMSNFRKVKRVEDTIKILHNLSKTHPVRLILIGDGPERSKVEQTARELEVYDKVDFLGKQDSIEKLISGADIFLMPSSNESFGLAALEAMACRVPCVSSNAEGLPEVNIHGTTGYMADVGDVESMSDFCRLILKDSETLESFKENAFQHSKNFSIDNIVPLYENYYTKIIEEVKENNLSKS